MSYLQKKIENSIPKDKLLHFCTGLLMSLLMILSVWFIIIPIVVGLGKELYDKYVRKTFFDVKDMLVTWMGVIPIMIILIIKNLLLT